MKIELTVIKSLEQYREYMAELESLLDSEPAVGSKMAQRLELLGLLVATYEKGNFPLEAPTPVEAIEFRLDQLGMKPGDLASILGSRSRVSEIFSGKRKLTIPMIRKLSAQLKIPANVLLGKDEPSGADDDPETQLLPLAKELVRRGWVEASRATSENAQDIVSELWGKLGVRELESAYFKKSLHLGLRTSDIASAHAWIARVVIRGRLNPARNKFSRKYVTESLLNDLARLSWFENGPLLARDYLSKLGIPLVVEEHLPGTGIDGGAALDVDGVPVIGLTLRHDRLDNFWFTLMHECVHVLRHLTEPGDQYVDDVESPYESDAKETEANRVARDALIPPAAWRSSRAPKLKTEEAVRELADTLRISPAIVAGRIRRDTGNYNLLTSLVGYHVVSRQFRN